MSEHFFTSGLTRCKRRQTWGRTLVNLLVLLALVALSCWLWGCVYGATVPARGTGPCGASGMPLAMMPWLQGSIMGLLAFGLVVLMALAARKMRRDDEAALGRVRWSVKDGCCEDVFASLRSPGGALPPAEVRRILEACASEARHIREHLKRAQRHLSVEDYGDELVIAEGKLDVVARCIEALMQRVNAGGASS